MQLLLSLSIALLAGLWLSRLTKLGNLPAVTAYLIAGILVGPYVLGRFGISGLGFISDAEVDAVSLICDVVLGFIAIAMGNEFRLSELKKIGKQAIVIAVCQAVAATVFVDVALITLHFLIPDVLPLSAAVTLGAIATATAPASTFMVVKQYKAEGPLTKLLLPIVALDDVIGLIIFAISFGIAQALEIGEITPVSVIVNPIIEIFGSLLLGALLGVCFHLSERFFHSRSKRMSISVCFVLLAVALSKVKASIGEVEIGFSPLLVCMMLGTVFCNLCDFSVELMDRMDRWTGPIMVLFFVISGAGLKLHVFAEDWRIVLIGVVFILFRTAGKILGAMYSAKAVKAEPTVQKYLGVTLLPQEGVCLGMSLMAMEGLAIGGPLIRSIALFSVLVYEMIAPLLTKIALQKAGEIKEKPIPKRVRDGLKHIN